MEFAKGRKFNTLVAQVHAYGNVVRENRGSAFLLPDQYKSATSPELHNLFPLAKQRANCFIVPKNYNSIVVLKPSEKLCVENKCKLRKHCDVREQAGIRL